MLAKTVGAQAIELNSISSITQPQLTRVAGNAADLEGEVGARPSSYEVPNLWARNRI